MARLSKSHHFKIFEDTGIPTPPTDENDPFNEPARQPRASSKSEAYDEPTELEHDDPPSGAEEDDDPLPRDSLTSVSSFPESATQYNDTDYAPPLPPPASPQKFFTPQVIRPSFRRPESVRRMQMASPRQSILSYYRSSRSGTPRSELGKGSPRGRRRITEESTSEEEEARQEEKNTHPLVLLHVTLLPIAMPWSMESMEELLPPQVLENLHLLRSKVTETVQQRGVLIPHPREEYEMLEERLLEALELKDERVTKCGHFRARISDSSVESSGRESDSGLGSSSDGSEDGERCKVCRHHIHCTAGKKKEWNVKVFAANGLMRSAAWAAAWSEMESVDIEVLPWISEEDRRKLDQRKEDEMRERERVGESADEMQLVIEQKMIEHHALVEEEVALRSSDRVVTSSDDDAAPVEERGTATDSAPKSPPDAAPADDLPPIYRSSQVPLSVLLRNYLLLLAQDRRNVAMFFLGLLAVFFALSSAPGGNTSASTGFEHPSKDTFPTLGTDEAKVNVEDQRHDVPVVSTVPEEPSLESQSDAEQVLNLETREEAPAPDPPDMSSRPDDVDDMLEMSE